MYLPSAGCTSKAVEWEGGNQSVLSLICTYLSVVGKKWQNVFFTLGEQLS